MRNQSSDEKVIFEAHAETPFAFGVPFLLVGLSLLLFISFNFNGLAEDWLAVAISLALTCTGLACFFGLSTTIMKAKVLRKTNFCGLILRSRSQDLQEFTSLYRSISSVGAQNGKKDAFLHYIFLKHKTQESLDCFLHYSSSLEESVQKMQTLKEILMLPESTSRQADLKAATSANSRQQHPLANIPAFLDFGSRKMHMKLSSDGMEFNKLEPKNRFTLGFFGLIFIYTLYKGLPMALKTRFAELSLTSLFILGLFVAPILLVTVVFLFFAISSLLESGEKHTRVQLNGSQVKRLNMRGATVLQEESLELTDIIDSAITWHPPKLLLCSRDKELVIAGDYSDEELTVIKDYVDNAIGQAKRSVEAGENNMSNVQ